MKHVLFALAASLALASPVSAQSTKPFGLENTALACLFLEEVQDIAEVERRKRKNCNTRSVTGFNEFGLLEDAYRADPDATLDLIERILKAGRKG